MGEMGVGVFQIEFDGTCCGTPAAADLGHSVLEPIGKIDACLMLVASQVTLANGSAAGSTCTGLGGSSSGTTVALVQ